METIDETEEASSEPNSEVQQLVQQIQQELEGDNKRHDNTLAYYKVRVHEEEARHYKQQ